MNNGTETPTHKGEEHNEENEKERDEKGGRRTGEDDGKVHKG